jgi:hypothetical protein
MFCKFSFAQFDAEKIVSNRVRKTVVLLVAILLAKSITSECQVRHGMSRTAIRKNNQRLMTYRGDIRNKYGSNKMFESIGITVNSLNYYGDLSPAPERISTDLSLTKPGIGVLFGKKVSPILSLRATFLYGTLSGSDSESADKNDPNNGVFRYRRNLSFRNRIAEFSFVGMFDFKRTDGFYTDREKWIPYAFAGIGLIRHNPQARAPEKDLNGNPLPNSRQWVNLRELGTEGQYAKLSNTDANHGIKPYRKIQPVVPFGIGIRMRINEQLDASAEFGFRLLFTDYVDDVSMNFVDPGDLDSDLARAMACRTTEIMSPTYTFTSEKDGNVYSVVPGYGHEHEGNLRGNRKDNDFYTTFSLQISYIIEKMASKKPKFR